MFGGTRMSSTWFLDTSVSAISASRRSPADATRIPTRYNLARQLLPSAVVALRMCVRKQSEIVTDPNSSHGCPESNPVGSGTRFRMPRAPGSEVRRASTPTGGPRRQREKGALRWALRSGAYSDFVAQEDEDVGDSIGHELYGLIDLTSTKVSQVICFLEYSLTWRKVRIQGADMARLGWRRDKHHRRSEKSSNQNAGSIIHCSQVSSPSLAAGATCAPARSRRRRTASPSCTDPR